ncbi:MAG: S-layer homology domain-containing protein [Chloroflexi bacterium]|nr:S-layer homology domain-containing protein [Chloroflexota bacterium]
MKPKFWHSSVILFVLLALAFSTLGVTPALAASAWEQVGAAGFSAGTTSYTSLAIDSGGTPYVVYQDWANNYKASVMKFNGTAWEQVGSAGFSAGGASSTSLAIDSGGTPYVAYRDGGNSGNASVMKFNGTAWEQVGSAGFSAGQTDYTSLAIYSGTPYVAYTDSANSNKASVMKFNGTAWEQVGSAGFSAGQANSLSLAIYSDTPYVAYRDIANIAKASVMKFPSAATTTALASSLNPSTFGNPVTFTATVSPTPDGGAVAFKDNGTVIPGCEAKSLSGGQAACDTSALTAGAHIITAEYSGAPSYTASTGTLSPNQQVNQAAPILTWADPANIVYGTALSGTQLNATANVAGAFTYTPASGTVLNVGAHTLHVDFVPTDTVNYANASKDVSITVTKAATVITWANPAAIDQGAPLSAAQLNATANVPGTFTYTPPIGTYLSTGIRTLHVDFVPTDAVNYANASKQVSLTINDHVLFNDVPAGHWARSFIERLALNQVTGGCGGGNFCPDLNITRDQMAVFILRAKHGPAYLPPAVGAGTGFNDVPTSHWAAAWIKQLVAEGISGGCGNNNFCPTQPVTRAQVAVFLLVAKHGAGYTPPAATGIFNDVPVGNWAAAWAEQLVAEGIASGCGGGNFCPNRYVTRAQMAVFLVTAFKLP